MINDNIHVAGMPNTAAAIAAGIANGGLGTDTGGSVRIPAALTGIVGLRPTSGRYSLEGVTPFSPTRDTVGPLARNVADVVLLDQVITGDLSLVQSANMKSVRLGVAMQQYRPKLQQMYAQAFAHYKIDALIFPTTPMPAQPLDNSMEVTLNGKKMSTLLVFVANTRPINNAGIAGLNGAEFHAAAQVRQRHCACYCAPPSRAEAFSVYL